MEFIKNLVERMNTEGETPSATSPIYIISLSLVILGCVVLVGFFANASNKVYRIIVGVACGIMIVCEVFKQIMFPMSVVDGELVYKYLWNNFPFQLCSTPLYVFPFLIFLGDGRLRDIAASYTMTYALLGGIAVFLFPKTVFNVRLVGNIQTMIHHGLQIIVGVYTAAYYRKRLNSRFFLGGILLFTGLYAVANLLNTVGYNFFVARGWMVEGEHFNMFYVSPRADQPTPVLSDFLGSLPPLLYIFGYFVAITVGALILMLLAHYIGKLSDHLKKKRAANQTVAQTEC